MNVTTSIVAITLCAFTLLLIASVQQGLIKKKSNDPIRSWLVFRLFLIWNILNECIVLSCQLGSSLDNSQNTNYIGNKVSAGMMRVFIRLNWCITGYLGFGLGVFVYNWMYKHVLLIDEEKRRILINPKKFEKYWILVILFIIVTYVTCIIIAVIVNSLLSIEIHSICFQFILIVIVLFYFYNCCLISYQLTFVISNLHSTSNSNSNETDKASTVNSVLKRDRNWLISMAIVTGLFIILSLSYNIYYLIYSFTNRIETANDHAVIDDFLNINTVETYTSLDQFLKHFLLGFCFDVIFLLVFYHKQTGNDSYCPPYCFKLFYPTTTNDFNAKLNNHTTKKTDTNTTTTSASSHNKNGTNNMDNKNIEKKGKISEAAKGKTGQTSDSNSTMQEEKEKEKENESVNLATLLTPTYKSSRQLWKNTTLTTLHSTPEVRAINGVGVRSVPGTSQLELQGIDVNTDLNQIDVYGRRLGKRKKPKAHKRTKEEREQLIANAKTAGVDNNNNNTDNSKVDDKIATLLDEVKADGAKSQTEFQRLAVEEPTYAPYDKPSFQSPSIPDVAGVSSLRLQLSSSINFSSMRKTSSLRYQQGIGAAGGGGYSVGIGVDSLENNNTSDTDKSSYKRKTIKKALIELVCFEFEDCLVNGTNIRIGHDKTLDEIRMLDLNQIILAFGGRDRLEIIHEFQSQLNRRDINCFLFSQEDMTENVEGMNERAGLLDYFNKQHESMQLSHVIGNDHSLYHDCDCKIYMIILKLMRALDINHEQVLYIGHNKEITQHLKDINVCQTYYVKTQGFTHRDVENIGKKYFDADWSVNAWEKLYNIIPKQSNTQADSNSDSNKGATKEVTVDYNFGL